MLNGNVHSWGDGHDGPSPQSLPLVPCCSPVAVGLCHRAGDVGGGGMLMVTVGSGDVATDGGAGNSGRSWEKGLMTFRGSYSSHLEF